MSGPKRILVADDEPQIVDLTCQALQDAGFETAQAFGGEEAIQWLENNRPPDLVICDHRMPGIDGVAVRDWMLEQPQLAGVQFIMLTGKTSGGEEFSRWFGDHINFKFYVTKPFYPQEVLNLAQRVLGNDGKASR